jgi:hypothetical protein
MILFGWGHQRHKLIGPTHARKCENCNNERIWTMHKLSTWFTLFFIPVFPYSSKRLLTCPVCGQGFELSQTEFEDLRPLAELNQKLATGAISEERYHHELARLKQPMDSSD